MNVQQMNKNQISLKSQTQSNNIWVLVALAMGFLMATLDVTVVNVAVAKIQDEFKMSLSGATWVVDGYILTFASLLLAAGALANRYGAKKIYMIGLGCFVFASFLCSVAPTGEMLIAARILQGASAALFMPSSISLLVFSYPDEKQRAKMLGLWTALVSTASGLGPFIGGVLVHTFGWQSIFLLNLPIGIIGFFMTFMLVAESPQMQNPINLPSHFLGMITLACISFALIEGPIYGWTSPLILSTFGLFVISAICFILKERKSKSPIISSQLFHNPNFSITNLVGFLLNFSLFGGIFMFGLYLQEARGVNPFMAGVQLLPMMIVFVVGNLLFARLTTRWGSKFPLLVALFVAGICSVLLITISSTMPYWLIAVIYAIANLGVGVSVPAMTAILTQAAGREHANIAGATLNATRQIGALVGVAVAGAVLHLSAGWEQGASMTFLVMAIVYLTAASLVWRFIRIE